MEERGNKKQIQHQNWKCDWKVVDQYKHRVVVRVDSCGESDCGQVAGSEMTGELVNWGGKQAESNERLPD